MLPTVYIVIIEDAPIIFFLSSSSQFSSVLNSENKMVSVISWDAGFDKLAERFKKSIVIHITLHIMHST